MSAVEKETLDEIIKRIDEKLELILEQTTRHNGRLSKVESWQLRAKTIFGIYSTITMVIIVPIILMLLGNFLHN